MANLTAETAWLGGPDSDGAACGFDVGGWGRSIWILHSMYEIPALDTAVTHDDIYRARRSAGVDDPDLVGDLNLPELGTVNGGYLGMPDQPKGGWRRLRWVELASRLDIELGRGALPPCFRWFPYRSWPASIVPPPEGSLDPVSLRAVSSILARSTTTNECVALYGVAATGRADGSERCFRGPLSAVDALVDRAAVRVGTPSNVWPEDRSWFVYTDWDLWGTKISGSIELIEAVTAHPDLETLAWEEAAP